MQVVVQTSQLPSSEVHEEKEEEEEEDCEVSSRRRDRAEFCVGYWCATRVGTVLCVSDHWTEERREREREHHTHTSMYSITMLRFSVHMPFR
jgi:hypothetical protein